MYILKTTYIFRIIVIIMMINDLIGASLSCISCFTRYLAKVETARSQAESDCLALLTLLYKPRDADVKALEEPLLRFYSLYLYKKSKSITSKPANS
jgi:hypothetical protein